VTDRPLLQISDLQVQFRSDTALARAVDGVSLTVNPGETVCLVGESGCGKTVTALSVLGLIARPPGRIAGGSILFQDKDLLQAKETALQRIRGKQIGMVFQDPLTSLNPVLTILDQISEPMLIHEGFSPARARQRCLELLEQVGIPSAEQRLLDYPHQFSGGQRQRIMIAMALACNPLLLIADEPTTALDVTIQRQIIGLFKSIQETSSRSLLYITHDLGVVSAMADRIYVMYAGVVVEEGGMEAIFERPRHPYTQGLIASLPAMNKRGQDLQHIPGNVPDPAAKPEGCPFHPRCGFAEPVCSTRFPQLVDCGHGQKSRCPVIN
jgi:peptide/nickel transport system ATP-binding protein/oligopeptide transport system ATP-binding protein